MDAELARRGLVSSRAAAQQAITAGLVTVDGAPAMKAATQVHAAQALVVSAPPRRYVSRGGDKLAHALDRFAIEVSGRRCLDAGVSTGGFTDCLLQAGAASVIAYDVGYGQVHDRLRGDPRVDVNERTNVRVLMPADIPPPPPDLLVADLSFISLALVLPCLLTLVAGDDREAVVLVKPQFEAERGDVGKGGVVRDSGVWHSCLRRVANAAAAQGWARLDATASPLLGPAGNVEFLVWLQPDDVAAGATTEPTTEGTDAAIDAAIDAAVTEGERLRRDA